MATRTSPPHPWGRARSVPGLPQKVQCHQITESWTLKQSLPLIFKYCFRGAILCVMQVRVVPTCFTIGCSSQQTIACSNFWNFREICGRVWTEHKANNYFFSIVFGISMGRFCKCYKTIVVHLLEEGGGTVQALFDGLQTCRFNICIALYQTFAQGSTESLFQNTQIKTMCFTLF